MYRHATECRLNIIQRDFPENGLRTMQYNNLVACVVRKIILKEFIFSIPVL